VLERMARASELGESVHPDQLKIWRSEIRVPAMYRDLKLSEKQLEQVQELQREQAEYFRARAVKKMEEGSQYSSDYEEVD